MGLSREFEVGGGWETKGATRNATFVTCDVRLSRVRSATVVRDVSSVVKMGARQVQWVGAWVVEKEAIVSERLLKFCAIKARHLPLPLAPRGASCSIARLLRHPIIHQHVLYGVVLTAPGDIVWWIKAARSCFVTQLVQTPRPCCR